MSHSLALGSFTKFINNLKEILGVYIIKEKNN